MKASAQTSALWWFLSLSICFLTYKLFRPGFFIAQARKIGLPYVIAPVLETEVIAKVVSLFIRPLFRQRFLKGKTWPSWIRFSISDWAWEDKRRAHDEHGDVFLVVSPCGMICYCADAEMAWDVMNRRNEFLKPHERYKVLEPYGPNVGTVNGKQHAFHHRITAPSFNDGTGVNELVWDETVSLTRTIMTKWSSGTLKGDLLRDVHRLSLGVISWTAFGQKLDLMAEISDLKHEIPPGFAMHFSRALQLVADYLILCLLLPSWLVRVVGLTEVALAQVQLEKHLRAIIRRETSHLTDSDKHEATRSPRNLLNRILHASAGEAAAGDRQQAFTESEVLGNVFLYFIAGYDTSAHALEYGLIILALRPDIQYQVTSEIDHVYAKVAREGRADLTYTEDFGKLDYTYGFMCEVLRLHPALMMIAKVPTKPTMITTHPKEGPVQSFLLPAGCDVYVNSTALHYNERYWPEPGELRPERWTNTATTERSAKTSVASDKTRLLRGTFQAFSGGGRACLGRRFAQSEYIALLVTLLRVFRVELADGMDRAKVQKEIDCLNGGHITHSPALPVKLVLKKRVS